MQNNQYTIRQIPAPLDKKLREKSKLTGKSLNEIVIEALKRHEGFSDEPMRYHDLDFAIGSWEKDAVFDKIISAQRKVDKEIWK